MLRSDPLLDNDCNCSLLGITRCQYSILVILPVSWSLALVVLERVLVSFEVLAEVLQQKHLLLDLFWSLSNNVCVDLFLPASRVSFEVGDKLACCVFEHLCIVVEVDADCAVGKSVAQSIFRAIVDPFLYPDSWPTLV